MRCCRTFLGCLRAFNHKVEIPIESAQQHVAHCHEFSSGELGSLFVRNGFDILDYQPTRVQRLISGLGDSLNQVRGVSRLALGLRLAMKLHKLRRGTETETEGYYRELLLAKKRP